MRTPPPLHTPSHSLRRVRIGVTAPGPGNTTVGGRVTRYVVCSGASVTVKVGSVDFRRARRRPLTLAISLVASVCTTLTKKQVPASPLHQTQHVTICSYVVQMWSDQIVAVLLRSC